MIRRIRGTIVALAILMAMAFSIVGAAPAHATVEYLAVRDWYTFAAWQAPGGNIYIAQYRASIASDTSTGYYAWRINTRCMVNGIPATCSRYATIGLAAYEKDPQLDLRWPWGLTDRSAADYKGEVIWQGAWHNTAPIHEFFILTDGTLRVHWTAPNVDSSAHWVCSDAINKDTQTVFPRSPTQCV